MGTSRAYFRAIGTHRGLLGVLECGGSSVQGAPIYSMTFARPRQGIASGAPVRATVLWNSHANPRLGNIVLDVAEAASSANIYSSPKICCIDSVLTLKDCSE